ncbi:MAG: hypothetical protein WC656_01250 [Sulfurimonas sp.]|jgi:hypothetical protein
MNTNNDLKNSVAIVEQTPKGHKFIKVNQTQMMHKLHSHCICDSCWGAMFDSYLIPVLNSAYCPHCFKAWSDKALYYEEDRACEDAISELFLKQLNA